MAFLVVLDSMTPAERVAFILHDVFGYAFAEVAEVVGRTPAACRQLASSARRRLRASQAPAAPTARQAGIVRDFIKAWEAGDIDALIGLLDPDATMTADGGGLVRAALRPIQGGEQIARLAVDVAGRAPGNLRFLERTVNGQPGLVAQHNGVTVAVLAFDVAGDRITQTGPWATPTSSGPGRWASTRTYPNPSVKPLIDRRCPNSPTKPPQPDQHPSIAHQLVRGRATAAGGAAWPQLPCL
jgi:RNA polymerase sigma-70 factor, ECF subfamily